MLIRSQDGKSMVSVDGAVGLEVLEIDNMQAIACIYPSGESISIGYYSSVGKAVKVLDMIQDTYLNATHVSANADGFGIAYTENTVFQMPEDGEIILVTDGRGVYFVEYEEDLDAPFGDLDEITAWMPSPEPYIPERKELPEEFTRHVSSRFEKRD